MPKPKRPLHTVLQRNNQPEDFPIEVEHLLNVLARIETRRQLRLRALELERKSDNATPETPS